MHILANDADLMGNLRNGRLANVLTVGTIVLLIILTAVLLVATVVSA